MDIDKIATAFFMVTLLTSCHDKEKRQRALSELDAAQQAVVMMQNEIQNLEDKLIMNIIELEVAKDDMRQAKKFQFLRTEAEREQQIRSATQYELKIENSIEVIKSNIDYYKDSVRSTEVRIERLKEFLRN